MMSRSAKQWSLRRLVGRYRALVSPATLMIIVMADIGMILGLPAEPPGFDAASWWSIDLANLYGEARTSMMGTGAFRFSPVVAQLFAPFGALPWILYLLVFLAIQLAAILLMSGKRWPFVVLLPPVIANLYSGNVDVLMGAAIVAGFRWPGAWAFLLLTKVTPGVGVLWFGFRREWRNLGIAVAFTLAVALVSFTFAPDLWRQWFEALRGMAELPQLRAIPPLPVRLALAVALLWFAARRGDRWLVPIVCLIAVPNPWFVTFSILGASVALWPRRGQGAGPPVSDATALTT